MSMRARSVLPFLFALFLVGACGAEEPARETVRREADSPSVVPSAPEIPPDAPLVVFLGDSLAAGRGLADHEAFPAVLQRSLASKHPFRLVNAGVSGATTASGVARLDWLLKQKPDVVVIELGANDGFRSIPAATIETNLRDVVTRICAAGATPLLLGMRIPPSYGADYARSFDAVFPRIAVDTDVAYVPFFLEGVAGIRELNQDDGIHPTAEGHRRLAENLTQALIDVIPRD